MGFGSLVGPTCRLFSDLGLVYSVSSDGAGTGPLGGHQESTVRQPGPWYVHNQTLMCPVSKLGASGPGFLFCERGCSLCLGLVPGDQEIRIGARISSVPAEV